jgi:hypothetical protein
VAEDESSLGDGSLLTHSGYGLPAILMALSVSMTNCKSTVSNRLSTRAGLFKTAMAQSWRQSILALNQLDLAEGFNAKIN